MPESKEKITNEEIAKYLWELLKKCSKEFYLSFKSDAEKNGFSFDSAQEIRLTREIVMIDMWIISKALSPDAKILDELHKIYLFGHSNMATTEEAKKEFPKAAEKELYERYKKYYESWNDKNSEQWVLALNMLEYMLNTQDNKILNIALQYSVITHIYAFMKIILSSMLNFKKEFEITDN